tara:strand:+ start:191 stop:1348 length:1158 start_codon:yes stop_codon:yes gene_type:complete
MKRVIVDAQYLQTAIGGIGTYTDILLEQVKKRSNGDFEYIIVPQKKLKKKSIYINSKGATFTKILHHVKFFVWKQFCLPLLCIKYKADFLLAPDYVVPFFCFRTKKIVVLHDSFFWKYPENYNPIWRLYFVSLIRLGLEYKAKIVTTSNYSKIDINGFLRPRRTIEVVYQSYNKLEGNLESHGHKWGDIANKNYVLHVGSFDKRKNLLLLVQAYKELVEERKSWQEMLLVLVGEKGENWNDEVYRSIVSFITKHHISDRVVLTGHIPDSELKFIYKNASLYVFPSLDEGFGIPMLESFEAGIPVIASDKGALGEIGGSGVLLFDSKNIEDLKSKMILVVNDSATRISLVEAGKKRLTLFSDEIFFNNIEEVLRKSNDESLWNAKN